MESIVQWMVISIGLGMIGTAVAMLTALRKRREIMSSLDPYDALSTEKDKGQGTFTNISLIYSIYPITGTIYCILISLLIFVFGVQTDVQHRVAVGSLLAVGLSALFGNLGRSMFYREVMEGIDEKGEGSLEYFGKYMVFLVLPEPALIYGLQIAILGLIFSGINMGTTPEFGMDTANSFLLGSVILGLSASGTIAMGYMFRITPPLFQDVSLFGKKMVKIAIPHFINILGLMVALLLMLNSGMLGD